MAKWQRAGSWYTEGAELLDETSSNSDRGSADESDRAKYDNWREQAKNAKKEVYQESPLAHGRRDASVARGQAAAHAGNADLGDLGKMWNPMQAKFELIELSERKAKVAARLLRGNDITPLLKYLNIPQLDAEYVVVRGELILRY
jgi:hypothetical protein